MVEWKRPVSTICHCIKGDTRCLWSAVWPGIVKNAHLSICGLQHSYFVNIYAAAVVASFFFFFFFFCTCSHAGSHARHDDVTDSIKMAVSAELFPWLLVIVVGMFVCLFVLFYFTKNAPVLIFIFIVSLLSIGFMMLLWCCCQYSSVID